MPSSRQAAATLWKSGMTLVVIIACCLPARWDDAAAAEPDPNDEAARLARTVQNPLANLVTLPFQANYDKGVGADGRTFFNLNLLPVVPFPGDKWNVISRTIIPYQSAPVGATDSISGFGDISLNLFWSPNNASSLTWGVGPSITLPTASNPEVFGSQKLSIGPTGVVFYGIKKWTLGVVASNVWSVAGDSTAQDVNFLFAQWFVNYNFGRGWALGSVPIITCDWEAASGEECTIPWGLQISKVTHFGARPVNLLAGYYENSTHPTGGPDSQVRIQLNFIFPQKK